MDAPTGIWRRIIGVCLLVVVILGELCVYNLHFETRAKVIRTHFVVLLQVIFCFVSKFIWNSLKFQPTSSSASVTSLGGVGTDLRDSNSQCSENDPKYWTLWKVSLFSYLAVCQSAYLTNYFLMCRDPHWYSVLSYCAIGSYIQLALALAVLRLINFGVCSSDILFRLPRRRQAIFSRQTIACLACSYALVASSLGIYSAAQMPGVKRVTVPIRGLPQSWDKSRIVQISDIHLGPTVGFTRLSAIVDVINGLKPDVVVMTGDLVDGPVTSLIDAASPLRNIWSRHGNYYVTGNHEYYTGDVDNWLYQLKVELGFTPLHNSNVKLGGSEKDVVCLAGTDDIEADLMGYTGHGFDVDKSLKSCDPKQPVILLTHQPRAARTAINSNYRIDLVLSGHTHGGQFFPMTVGAYFFNPFFAGLYKYKDSYVYVSQGTQFFGIPFRLLSSMEITEITLQATN